MRRTLPTREPPNPCTRGCPCTPLGRLATESLPRGVTGDCTPNHTVEQPLHHAPRPTPGPPPTTPETPRTPGHKRGSSHGRTLVWSSIHWRPTGSPLASPLDSSVVPGPLLETERSSSVGQDGLDHSAVGFRPGRLGSPRGEPLPLREGTQPRSESCKNTRQLTIRK